MATTLRMAQWFTWVGIAGVGVSIVVVKVASRKTVSEQVATYGASVDTRLAPAFRCAARSLKCLAWTMALLHILLAVWVYTDIRKRGEGHGIFIVLVLLAGLPAAILYALVRIGDAKRGT
jgi:hypothetical protein